MGVVLFYVGTIGFASGVFSRSFFDIGLPEIVWALVISGVAELIRRRRNTALAAPYLLGISVFLFFSAIGAFRLEYASWYAENPIFEANINEEVSLVGVITREPDVRESTIHLYVDIEGELLLITADRFGTYAYGDEVTVEGMLTKPESFETDLGRTFNYPDYLKARGVNYMVRFAKVSVVGSGNGNVFLTTLLNFKHSFMGSVESLLPEPHVGLSEGLLLGVKRALGSELEEVFRKTGIIHIVVLSGYNVMLVVIFVTYLLSVILPQRAHLPFGIIAIASFALLVGLSATVVRASIMASLILLAKAMNRTYMVIRALMLAGVVMLIINPYLLAFDTGFQLSFVATLGLILVAPHLEKKLTLMPKAIGLREFLTATLATQLFVMPILLYQIGEFSVVSVVVNVLVLPMVPVAMFLTFITGIAGFFSAALGGFLALLTYFSLAYILAIASWFAELPFASFVVPAFPFYLVPVAYAAIGYVLWRLYYPRIKNDIDELDGWVIEEEEELRMRIVTTAKQTPVFFK